MTTLIHTADWHLGKTFHRFSADPAAQERLRAARYAAVEGLGALASEVGADAVLVAGDLFHSNEVDDRGVLKALDAIGAIGVPVIAIPGNHDHAGAGSVWERAVLREHRAQRAPLLRVVHEAPEVVPVAGVEILALPVHSRHQRLALRELAALESERDRPRVGLVHGAVDDIEGDGGGRSLVLAGAEQAELALLALGDYHRCQRVEALPCAAWYAGCHEPDGFPSHHRAGERVGGCLVHRIADDGTVDTRQHELGGGLRWVRLLEPLRAAADLDRLEARLRELAAGRAGSVLCRIDCAGSVLGYGEHERLDALLRELEPAFEHLAREGRITLEPDAAELEALTRLPGIAGAAARRLHQRIDHDQDDDTARAALAQLHRLQRSAQGGP